MNIFVILLFVFLVLGIMNAGFFALAVCSKPKEEKAYGLFFGQ